MIPIIPNNDGYVVGPNGEQLRTPLQQIEKNKKDITAAVVDSLIAVNKVNNMERRVEALENETVDLPNKIERPDIPSDDSTQYYLVAINKDGETIAKPYSNQASGNSVAMRTGGGGLLIVTQYGNAEMAATLTALEIAQTMNYVDYFTNASPSYPYKPYQLAAKGWGATISLPEGTITDLPQGPDTEWYQKVVNAHDNPKTVILKNGVQFNGSSYKRLNQCVSLYTDKATHADSAIADHPAGREDLRIIIAPHSTINIRCRNRPTGYTQIWIT